MGGEWSASIPGRVLPPGKDPRYLGTIVTSDYISAEINSRILMANKCYYGLKNQLQSHYQSRDTKCKLYKTLIRPVITYGSESWTLNKGNTDKLEYLKERFCGRYMEQLMKEGLGESDIMWNCIAV
jgi:hypothetical protein